MRQEKPFSGAGRTSIQQSGNVCQAVGKIRGSNADRIGIDQVPANLPPNFLTEPTMLCSVFSFERSTRTIQPLNVHGKKSRTPSWSAFALNGSAFSGSDSRRITVAIGIENLKVRAAVPNCMRMVVDAEICLRHRCAAFKRNDVQILLLLTLAGIVVVRRHRCSLWEKMPSKVWGERWL
jgi:hypothetical protein